MNQKWIELVESHDSSIMNVKEFCSLNGISTASFYKYRRRIKSKQSEIFLPIVIDRVETYVFICNGYHIEVCSDMSDDVLSRILKATSL